MTVALSRRGVMAGGLAVAALPLAADFAILSGLPFLYDTRLDADGRLLEAARRLGLRPLPLPDLASIAHDLDVGQREHLPGIAGVTGPAAFFIVQQIAERRGLPLRDRRGPAWAFGAVGSAPRRRWS